MADAEKIVLSVSRRTDIPAFYMDWFMAGIKKGEFRVTNPFNGREKRVPAGPEQVHTIVFWSKNFGPFLSGGFGEKLTDAGFHLFFNFTVNTTDPLLEPNLPPLSKRLQQMAGLAKRFGPERIHWRFDPICFYRFADGRRRDNLGEFAHIADAAQAAGIGRCITSFMDWYRKIERRTAGIPGFSFETPPMDEKKRIIEHLEKQLAARSMALYTCCEKDLLAALESDSTVRSSACIPGREFVQRDGGRIPLKRDPGQRRAAGCGCTVSADVGSYRDHPCYHNCLFCYANPTPSDYTSENENENRLSRP